MNGLKFVAIVIVVVLLGVMVWQYLPVEVETGMVEVCGNNLHQGEREISRQVEIKRVPRWQSSNYRVTENVVDCESCKEEVRRQSLEAERQARIAREAAEREAKVARVRESIIARVGMYGYAPVVFNNDGEFRVSTTPGEYELSLTPGRSVSLTVSAVNKTNEPLDAGKFKLRIDPPGSVVFEDFQVAYGISSRLPELLAQWKKLIGDGLPIGELNPCTNSYYKPETWQWPPPGTGNHRTNVSESATPGTDIRITGYVVIDGVEIETNTAVIHVMHP